MRSLFNSNRITMATVREYYLCDLIIKHRSVDPDLQVVNASSSSIALQTTCHGRERASSHYPPPSPPFRPQKAPGVTSRSVSKHPWHLNISQILRGVSLGQPGACVRRVHPRFRVPENPRSRDMLSARGCAVAARKMPACLPFFPQSQGERTCALLPVLLLSVDAEAEREGDGW